jgi:hypothetical protein
LTKRTARAKSLRVTKNIHEKRVRARGRVQFAAFGVVAGEVAPRRGVRFPKATIPLRLLADAFVRCGMKISVCGVVPLTEQDRRLISYRALVWQFIVFGPSKRSKAKFFAETIRITDHRAATSKQIFE